MVNGGVKSCTEFKQDENIVVASIRRGEGCLVF